MKKQVINSTLSFFLIILSSISGFSQNDSIDFIDWKINEKKMVYGYSIVRLIGENNSYSMTNCCFRDLNQILKESEDFGREMMYSEKEIEERNAPYKIVAQGGEIKIYIGRETQDAAHGWNFRVILQDLNGKEILRKEFEKRSINMSRNYRGSNENIKYATSLTVNLDRVIKSPFYVFIVDDYTTIKYQFKVTPTK